MCEWFTLTLGPPLNLPLGGGGDGSRERGFRGGNGGLGAVREPPLRVFLWVPACAGMTGGGLSEPQITRIFADGL